MSDRLLERLMLLVACTAMGWQAAHAWYFNVARGLVCTTLVREWALSLKPEAPHA